ncbi:RNA polymerase sigma factor [Paludisphaera mucosa]|uniref:Sigma-70 family RNA polymerase sigma factor n=1 Tax=Paludisphaera mucosa TaxID=3030827 RepID=A0ABT6FAK0_9BACT|nr:sigma-70 family RNA polymerase sigma factor [Paludisphaera mucosa]MDG3004613.1 sigma-70 family RNA polymerase sigma factor [Paludisphaera mucosa]
MSDSLLRRVAAGDQSAIEEVLERYGGLVWSLARKLSADPADAEDGVQEAFIDVWRAAGRFDETLSSESAFVVMIARRRLIDRARKRGRSPKTSNLAADLVSEDLGQFDRLERDDDVARVTVALRSLRPEQQAVLRLAVYDGLTHTEIARVTGRPLGSVKTLVRRGLMQIRDLLRSVPGVDARGGSE